MGYNVSAILIKPQIPEPEFTSLIHQLGFKDFHFEAEVPFGYSVEEDKASLYIGNYNGATILYDCVLISGEKREENGRYKSENIVIRSYPDHKIIFLDVVDAVPACYFHIVDKGKTIRRKLSDGFILNEEGDELPLEKECYTEKVTNDENEVIYRVTAAYTRPDGTGYTRVNEYRDNEIGGEITFKLCSEFIGHRFEELGNTPFNIHKYIEDK
jgi:hypothetical protein